MVVFLSSHLSLLFLLFLSLLLLRLFVSLMYNIYLVSLLVILSHNLHFLLLHRISLHFLFCFLLLFLHPAMGAPPFYGVAGRWETGARMMPKKIPPLQDGILKIFYWYFQLTQYTNICFLIRTHYTTCRSLPHEAGGDTRGNYATNQKPSCWRSVQQVRIQPKTV